MLKIGYTTFLNAALIFEGNAQPMTVEEALVILEKSLEQKRLSRIQELVFRQVWSGQSYMKIAADSGYDAGYIKNIAYKLWQVLSNALGEKVTKTNVQSVLKRRHYPKSVISFHLKNDVNKLELTENLLCATKLAIHQHIFLSGDTAVARAAAFSADGRILAVAVADCKVKLWNIDTGQCLQTLQGHTSAVDSVAFNPTGQVLVSCSQDETIRLWDIQTGQCLKVLKVNA